jgi:thioredoxin-dependent peroxiredoxin
MEMRRFFIHTFLFIVAINAILYAGGATMLLDIGGKAPAFTLVSSDGDTVRLSDFTGKSNVMLIFYPGDETPGCTKQLCAIRDDYAAFETKATKVFGVNPGTMDSHRRFVKTHTFQFPLLIDKGRTTAKDYRCDSWPFIKRTVYVIDKKGTIIYAKSGMPANAEILKAIPDEGKP